MTVTYLDSSVIISSLLSSEDRHIEALDILTDPDRRLVVSPFVELEVLPHLARVGSKQLDYAKVVFGECEAITDLEGTLRAGFSLLEQVNMGAMDALHIGAALLAGCDEIVTGEKPRKKSMHEARSFLSVLWLGDVR